MSGGDSPPAKRPEPAAARALDRLDRAVARGEEWVLVAVLAVLIAVGAFQAIATNLVGLNSSWPFEVIHYAVFTLAIIGAAYASQRGQQIGIDVLTRLLPPRPRAMVHIVIALFVAGICILLVVEGLDVREQTLAGSDYYEVVPPGLGLLAFPVGAGLIAFHFLVQAAIKISYLATGAEPPVREESPVH